MRKKKRREREAAAANPQPAPTPGIYRPFRELRDKLPVPETRPGGKGIAQRREGAEGAGSAEGPTFESAMSGVTPLEHAEPPGRKSVPPPPAENEFEVAERFLARFVDGRYRLQTYTSYDAAMRDAVTRMRLTQLPVSLAVMDGNHAWVLHGFTATADPAVTRAFRITSVRVTGPLWGRQSVNGYDMPPDTKLSYDAFRRFFRPFHYAPVHMVWDGRYVTVQPIPRVAAPAAPTAAPTPAFVPRLQLVTQPRMIRV